MYQIGDKVIPISKSIGIPYNNSDTVKMAKKNSYMTIGFIGQDELKNIFYECEPGGGHFLDKDLISYVTNNRQALHFLKR